MVEQKKGIRLGIAVVYFISPGNEWVVDLNVRQIKRNTSGIPYQIYAGCNRLIEPCRSNLAKRDDLMICPLPESGLAGALEHAFYLDRLVRAAVADGCTHVATFDVDSFPITPFWAERLIAYLTPNVPLAAVFRAENDDRMLPHPCGIIMSSEFVAQNGPVFWPDDNALESDDFLQFLLETGQRIDTGIGYSFVLWRNQIKWKKLLRSNRVNYHFLMGGIYDDVIFHIGASSREPIFHKEWESDWLLRVTGPMCELPFLWRLNKYALDRIVQRNLRILERISERLQNCPEEFFRYLLIMNGGK